MRIRNWGYPVLMYLMALGLVVEFGMTDYVMESDAALEYTIFMAIVESGHWIAYLDNLLSYCLMTTWVPAQLVRLFDAYPFGLFMWYVFILVSFLPVAVYFIARRWLNSHYAFLAGLFVMMQMYFWGALRSSRLNVACLFFALLILVIWSKPMKRGIKPILVTLLSLLLITSHYSSTYIAILAFGVVLVSVLILWWVKKIRPYTLVTVALTLVVLIAGAGVWYTRTMSNPLSYSQRFIEQSTSIEQFEVNKQPPPVKDKSSVVTKEEVVIVPEPQYSFFSAGTREEVVEVAFGKTFYTMNTPQRIEFVFSWLLALVLSFGLLVTLWHKNVDVGYKALCGAMFFCILSGIAIPVISNNYGIVRIFYLASIPLSVCFVIGATQLGKCIKGGGYAIALSIIIPYYLCVSGVIHGWFGVMR